MKIILYFKLLLIYFLLSCSTTDIERSDLYLKQGASSIQFTPEEFELTLINLIKDARKTIDISMYGFDNEKIASEIINVYQQSQVKVRVSTEFDSEELKSYQQFIAAGIPVQLGNSSGIQHNKFLIFDNKYLVTGSTNLTGGMQHHFNNMIVFKHFGLVADFQREFDIQWSGYYAVAKDTGHKNVFGKSVWDEITHNVGSWQVNAYFTPYKNTFASYRTNDANANLCSIAQRNLCSKVDTNDTAQTDQCQIQDTAQCPTEMYHSCYDDSRSEYVYRYYDNDKQVFVCQGYDNALNKVLPLIQNAKESIMVFAFAFRDKLIKDEIMRKKEQGLDVKIWTDYNQYRSGYKLSGASFQAVSQKTKFLKITRRANSGLLHHKVIVIDKNIIVLGSLNFSQSAANSNDENFLIIRNAPDLAQEMFRESVRIDRESYFLPLDDNFTDVFEDATGAGATNL